MMWAGSLALGACAIFFAGLPALAEAPSAAPLYTTQHVVAIGGNSSPSKNLVVPAGTVLDLELTETLSDRTVKRGDRFGLRLVAPISANGQLAIPAGTLGFGEVIDVAKPGPIAMKPARLILSGRALQVNGQVISIKGFRIMATGLDTTNLGGLRLNGNLYCEGDCDRHVSLPPGTRRRAVLGADVTVNATQWSPNGYDT